MSTNNKILGAELPGLNTWTTLYTVPANTQVIASIFIANQSTTLDDLVSVMLIPSGEADNAKYCIIGNGDIGHGTALSLSSFALGAGDKIKVKSQEGLCSFVSTGMVTS